MEKNLTLSQQETDLLLASLADDGEFCADLKMVLGKNRQAFDERIKSSQGMNPVIENILITTWPSELILQYIQNIVPNPKIRKKLLQNAEAEIVWTLIEKSAPSADESQIILERKDGLRFLSVLLQKAADFNEECEKIIFTRANVSDIETYCLECQRIQNIGLLLSDIRNRHFLEFYLQNNPLYGTLYDKEVKKIVPYPEILKLYTEKHTVPFSEVKDDKNFESYINKISLAVHDWFYGGMSENMLVKFLQSALQTRPQKKSLEQAVERYGNKLSLLIAQTLNKIGLLQDDELIECLLKNSDKEILKLIPVEQCVSAAMHNQDVKRHLLKMQNAEITSRMIDEDPLGYEFEDYLWDYPETERKKLIVQHGRKYGFAQQKMTEVFLKYNREAYWQQFKSIFNF